ncbi:AI-2E family transporter [Anaerolineales bacterium HSG6]|nr:AI-2E family transporter [Anaerolineales bacterium HSG6]MDM8530845.1 AI-2E family transporter [Anaerolineales bacterium HSG25]
MPPDIDSPNWDRSTKILVAALMVVLFGIAVWFFQSLIYTLVVAGMIAYLLNLPIIQLEQRTVLTRSSSVGVVYLVFFLVTLILMIVAGVTVYQQGQGLFAFVQEMINDGPTRFQQFMSQPIHFGVWQFRPADFNIDLEQVAEQIITVVRVVVGQGAQFVGVAAINALGWLGSTLIILVLSIYFAMDLPRFGNILANSIHEPGYRHDVERLLAESGHIWNAYLRGQTTLAIITGSIVAIGLTVLGVNNSLALGLLAGILDFIPFLGPAIIIGLSTLVALFQDGNWMGLSSMWFALVVFVFGLIVQQIEGNWLNPRIMGSALGLHPLLIMVGAIMGSTVAGILGVILAAPVMATGKLLGTYIWRKMFDLKPFPITKDGPPTPNQSEPPT